MATLTGAWRALGPAMARGRLRDVGLGALGAALGLAACAWLILSPEIDLRHGLYMIAPLGASAALFFAVPNSPLAQPWSAVVGNSLSAAVAVAVLRLGLPPALTLGLATGLAILAMSLARALHPPGGAVAMTAALSPQAIQELGFRFVLAPVAVGTVALVLIAMAHARVSGRHYPLRQTPVPGVADRPPAERLGLGEADLAAILRDYRQSANLGTEDLARLIAAAELQSAGKRLGTLTCAEIMSRDLVTVRVETPLAEVAEIFRTHAFTSLPVVDEVGRLAGVVFQIHLIRGAIRARGGFAGGLADLLSGRRWAQTAGDVMEVALPRATLHTPAGLLLPWLADGRTEAVPVMEHGRLVGIVTRTDLLGALAHRAALGA